MIPFDIFIINFAIIVIIIITWQVWSLFTGVCLSTFSGHDDAVTCLQFNHSHVISGSLDCTLKFWNLHSGKVFQIFLPLLTTIHLLQFLWGFYVNLLKLFFFSFFCFLVYWNNWLDTIWRTHQSCEVKLLILLILF